MLVLVYKFTRRPRTAHFPSHSHGETMQQHTTRDSGILGGITRAWPACCVYAASWLDKSEPAVLYMPSGKRREEAGCTCQREDTHVVARDQGDQGASAALAARMMYATHRKALALCCAAYHSALRTGARQATQAGAGTVRAALARAALLEALAASGRCSSR